MKTFQKCEDVESYYVTLVHHDLSFREHTRQMYGHAVLRFGTAQFYKYALQAQVQRSRREEVATDSCASNCSTAKACVLLDQHGRLVGYDVDCEQLTSAETGLLVTIASPLLCPDSSTTASAEVKAAAKVSRKEREVLLASDKASAREALPGLDVTQAVLRHIFNFISTTFEHYVSYEMCRLWCSNTLSLVLRSRIYSTDTIDFLADECAGSGCISRGLRSVTGRSNMGYLLAVTFRKKLWWCRTTGHWSERT